MPLNLDKARNEYEEVKNRTYEGSADYIKFKEGPNVIRILPPPPGMDVAWVKAKVSYNVGPNNRSVTPRFDTTCPLKREIDRLVAIGDEASKGKADKMYPRSRVFFVVTAREPHEQHGKVLLWNTSMAVFKEILGIISDPDYGDITDPLKGTDITVIYTPQEKSDTGFAKQSCIPKRHSSPLGTPEQIEEWTKANFFEALKIGKPSEDGYVLACIEGSEQAYLDTLKGNRQQERKAEHPASSPATASASEAHSPNPMPPPAASHKKVHVPDPSAKYWIADPTNNSSVVQADASRVGQLVLEGYKFSLMKLDQSGGWQTPEQIGFRIEEVVPTPPPAPAAPPPPAAPAPPPAPAAPAPAPAAPAPANEDEAALLAQLQKLREAKASGAPSQVAQDLRSQLRG